MFYVFQNTIVNDHILVNYNFSNQGYETKKYYTLYIHLKNICQLISDCGSRFIVVVLGRDPRVVFDVFFNKYLIVIIINLFVSDDKSYKKNNNN